MEVEKICCGSGGGGGGMISGSQEDDDAQLPGFRFHPTDEELVGFYLRRKVEKRAIRIELIKQVDIYKYDPWDLPKEASSVGDKEWYFFCKRGRKYRNSIRPNRVTGSGFWKATGIDRPIYSAGGEGRECIGLKKSLVYYRGSAGKGTKTDWMMHEFRLPSNHDDKSTKHIDVKSIAQEAEVWTLCRIFKRNVTCRKCIPDWKELAARKNNPADTTYKTCSPDSDDHHHDNYINFGAPTRQTDKRQFPNYLAGANPTHMGQPSLGPQAQPAPYPGLFSPEINEFIKYGDWDELRSVVEYSSFDPSSCK